MKSKKQQFIYGETLGIIAFEQGINSLLNDPAMMKELQNARPGEKTHLMAGWQKGWTKANLAAPIN